MNTTRSADDLHDPLSRAFYLPRLSREYYCGDAVVFWTLTIQNKAKGWLDQSFHCRFRELMLHTLVRGELLCPIYCLMPDHIHLIWMGLRKETDQRTGMAFFRTHLGPEIGPAKLQHQAHDRVLREEQRKRNAFGEVCAYVANNPVRAELIEEGGKWDYTGCLVPGYPQLDPSDQGEFWQKFWRIHGKLRQTDAGEVKRPPLS